MVRTNGDLGQMVVRTNGLGQVSLGQMCLHRGNWEDKVVKNILEKTSHRSDNGGQV